MATTYKYQQNFSGGASAGYVKYNITPDFGTPLFPGDTIEISGIIRNNLHETYGIGIVVNVQIGGAISGIDYFTLPKTVRKGVSSTFTMTITVTQDLISILNQKNERYAHCPIEFVLFSISADLFSGTPTSQVTGQELYIFSHKLAPTLSNFILSESTGAYNFFGVGVQGRNEFVIDFDYQLDPMFTDIAVSGVTVALNDVNVSVKTLETSGGHARIVLDAINTITVNAPFSVTLLDSEGASATLASDTPITIVAYAPPTVTTVGGVDLARRYDYQTDDYGGVQLVFLPEGKYVMLNFATSVTSIASKNAWTLKVEYADASATETVWTTAATRSYPDGETMSFIDDITLVGETHIFDAGLKYMLRVTVTDFFETAVLIGTIDKAVAYFHITKHGVAIGMRSTADFITQKAEFAYPAYFYAGINGVTNYSTSEVATGGRWINGKPIYRRMLVQPITRASSYTDYDIGPDVDMIINFAGVLVLSNGTERPLGWWWNSGNDRWTVYRYGKSSAVSFWATSVPSTGYVMIEYTKTTDAAE